MFAWWILTGILERFPGLKIVFVEPSLTGPCATSTQLDRKAAAAATTRSPAEGAAERVLPARNMAVTFMDDEVGLDLRHVVGIENILWSTDFPHPATTWPHSRETVDAAVRRRPRRRA